MIHADYIAFELKSPETALQMVKGLKRTINNLSIFPQSHGLDEDEELSKYGIRKVYYKKYKIYFLIDVVEKTVFILRIFHMRSDRKNEIINIFNN